MENILVKNLMVPLTDYTVVPQTASLREAVIALEKIQDKPYGNYPHQAVLVKNEAGDIVGKISKWDVIRSLEPKYKEIGEFNSLSRFGFSVEFIKNMQSTYNLWQHEGDSLSELTANICVKDVMYTPNEGEYVSENSTLKVALHLLAVGKHHSLIVLKDKKVVGVLRFVDVFNEIAKWIKQ
ncbi:MAG: CBS domain-containing protein [Planctomycetota bacterium]